MTFSTSNRLNLNYAEEARSFRKLPAGITDVHVHLNGERAIEIYKAAAEAYGIGFVHVMTQPEYEDQVRRILNDRARFIAVPDFHSTNPLFAHGKGFVERIKRAHLSGTRIAKFWSAPRITDCGSEPYRLSPFRLNSPSRLEAIKVAADLGMLLMVHVGDPDTWFKTKYADSNKYGTKAAQYDALEQILTSFENPVLAAHMGGNPEDLDFLSKLLARHSNLYLDTGAVKWMVRELAGHPREKTTAFFQEWKGRILFGSDIVVTDTHLFPSGTAEGIPALASSPEEAFDLYASRYWTLRTFFETDYRGESPISDPDLVLLDPEHHRPEDGTSFEGLSLPAEILNILYHDAARDLFEPLYA